MTTPNNTPTHQTPPRNGHRDSLDDRPGCQTCGGRGHLGLFDDEVDPFPCPDCENR